jgi:hypothetical protein
MDVLSPVIILCLLLSPFIFFLLKKRNVGLVNLIVIVFGAFTWIGLIDGFLSGYNWDLYWKISLFLSICFLIAAITIVFLRITVINRYIVFPLVLLITGVSWFFSVKYEVEFISSMFLYFAPFFVITFFVIGLAQHFFKK